MNAIDEIGQSIGVTRDVTWSGGVRLVEEDEHYALRILRDLYDQHKKMHGLNWSTEREESSQEYWAAKGEFRGYVWRQAGAWWFQAYHCQTGKVLVRGSVPDAPSAQHICALAIAAVS